MATILKWQGEGNERRIVTASMTEEEYMELNEASLGMCLACGAIRDTVEPDAEGYECQECHALAVMGAEQMLMEGILEFREE
jgi:hypothetical protein